MKNSIQTPTYLRDYKVPPYLIEKVALEFTLEEDWTIVKSTLDIYSNPASDDGERDLRLDGQELELLSVFLDDKRLSAEQLSVTADSLIIANVPSQFRLTIETRIKPQQNTALSGLYKSSGNFCTQCEAQGFRRITYFIDRPDVMARFSTTIIADEKLYPILLSNGNLISEKKLSGGKHTVTWEDPFRKPCYLFALVAGQLDFVEDTFVTLSGRTIILRLFVEIGNRDKCAHAMQALKKAMRWDEEKYGREYDLDIYMIVAVSDFNMGAMENKGLNIFNTQYILAKSATATDADYVHVEAVIAHEYFHNWTGNRITCRDWFQLSLKEGLTVFRDQSFTADTTSRATARIHDVNELRNGQFIEDAGPLAHPVRPDSYVEINNFYTSTVYNKGAEVIRMQQTILGHKIFRKGMDLYFSRHDGQAVTIEDFVKAMEDAANVNLTQFRLWYSQAGTPCLDIEDQYDAKEKIYTLHIKQSCLPTPGQPEKKPFHIPIKIGLMDATGKEVLDDILHVKAAEQTFHFKNIAARPIPSLLREFTAPVKVNYFYSDAALQLLWQHDTDAFNRWEAGQRYAVNLILRLVHDFRKNIPLKIPESYFATFEYLIQTMQEDKLLLTEMLTLPTEKYIGEQMAIVDVEAIHAVREFILTDIAKQLKNTFLDLYQQNNQLHIPYQFDMLHMGKRRLTGLSLFYLTQLKEQEIYQDLLFAHFKAAINHNMTDTIAALSCLVNSPCEQREIALQEFYNKWQEDALVVNKWFSLQATSTLKDTLSKIKNLLQHPAFDIKNPNKVYALIGSFIHRNPIHFHVIDGTGYQFLTQCVLQLDALNPQVAARMVKPLSDWQRYDASRQLLMCDQLEYILQQPVSKDVYELVSKSLHK